MFIDRASRLARHSVATLITFVGITVVWFVLWTLLSLLILMIGNMSLATYIGGLFLVLVGLLPALAVVVPAVLFAERMTDSLGVVRYVAQIPIVIGLTFLFALALLFFSGLLAWLWSPLLLEYAGLSVFMALPIAVVYWLTAKCVEFGIESVRETITLIFAGLRGAIDLLRYLRSGEIIKRSSDPTPAPAPVTPPPTDTTHNTPSIGPEARGR
jgi:hypothetical protein